MSAALQLPYLCATGTIHQQWRPVRGIVPLAHYEAELQPQNEPADSTGCVSVAFYRKHTEKMLRRYLYASMLVGRAPAILGEPVGRGWVSSRKVKTFEDAVIFVLDIERCLKKLTPVDQAILSRVVLQEYTHAETAGLLGVSVRAISYKYKKALDSLTELLLQSELLILPPS
ncbi:MAG: sigma-70 region 4 domain-containing protein [Terracidiphilus sp.]